MGELHDLGKARRDKAFEDLRARVKQSSGADHGALAFEATMLAYRYPNSIPHQP